MTPQGTQKADASRSALPQYSIDPPESQARAPYPPPNPGNLPPPPPQPISPPPAPQANPTPQTNPEAKPKKPSGWLKFLRLVLWTIIILAITTGFSLIAISKTPSSFANGTFQAKVQWGNIIFFSALAAGIAHLIWGATRWFLRWRREKWKTGKVIGKIIGGGIWRFFAILPVVFVAAFFIAPAINSAITAKVIADREASLTNPVMKIEGDFATGKITANQYVRYLVDAAYRSSTLPAEYRDDHTIIAPDITKAITDNLANLDQETLEYAISTIIPTHIAFGTDASGNISAQPSVTTWQPNAAHAQTSDVTTLNKAKLSSNEKFLIFYTDTGDDKITDESAAKLSGMLDTITTNYQSKLGLNFTYEKLIYKGSDDFFGKTAEQKMGDVLSASGIDPKHLDTAMYIYVANSDAPGTDALAMYTGRRFKNFLESTVVGAAGLFGDNRAAFTNSSPVVPFITIFPENLEDPSLELVTAHELAHHYASDYCHATFGKECSDEDFINETAANFMAVNVVENQPSGKDNNIINGHHHTYIKFGHCYSIPDIVIEPPKEGACHKSGSYEGYPTVAFLDNYADIVPDGKIKIFNALVEDNAWSYLYDQAGADSMHEVLARLAQRNLTNDYGHKNSLKAEYTPPGEDIPCNTACVASYTSKYATSQYFYFPADEFKDKTIIAQKSFTYDFDNSPPKVILDDSLISHSVLGHKSDGTWDLIDSTFPRLEYTIRADSEYDSYAFVITNYSKEGTGEYYIDIEDAELAEIIEKIPETPEEPPAPGLELSGYGSYGNCIWFEVNDFVDSITQVMQTINGFKGIDVSDSIAEWKKDAAALKAQDDFRKMTVCATRLKPNTALDTARTHLKNATGWTLDVFSYREANAFFNVMAGYDLFRQSTHIYILAGLDSESWLYSVVTEP